ALDVGPERRLLLQDLDQLRADIRRRGFDLVEPGKVAPLVELDLREPREEVLAGLLEVDPLAARQNVERIPEASGGAPLDQPAGEEPLPEIGCELRGVALAHGLGAAELIAQIGWQLVGGRSGVDRGTVERGRGA